MGDLSFADAELGVSDFVILVNQTFEYAYSTVNIRGELANFKVSKGKWIYFDLKDDTSMVRFFGTVFQLQGPLEDGMILVVQGTPRLHPRYGFSVSVVSIQPSGQGAIKRSAELLQATLAAEGLFDSARKRLLPYPPMRIGLITSVESAAYADFMKILNARWRGVTIECSDVQVQGDAAPAQIVTAIEALNREATPPDVLVLIRGGGSAEDLYVFSTEVVTRTVAASRVPTLVAIGHEIDVSLAELAADRRASTPSNAAELLVPDRTEVLRQFIVASERLRELAHGHIRATDHIVKRNSIVLERMLEERLAHMHIQISSAQKLLEALNPHAITKRGYAIVRLSNAHVARHVADAISGDIVDVELGDGHFQAVVR